MTNTNWLAGWQSAAVSLYAVGLLLGLANVLMDCLTVTSGRLHSRLPYAAVCWLAWMIAPGSPVYGRASCTRQFLAWKALDAGLMLVAMALLSWLLPTVLAAVLRALVSRR